MSPHWLEFLKSFGNPRSNHEQAFLVGELERFLQSSSGRARYDVLFQIYGPRQGSAWEPYHCPTLFAAIDQLNLSPKLREPLGLYTKDAPDDAFQWLSSDTMVIVDLHGSQSVQFGVRLIEEAGQPICTFDHWPGLSTLGSDVNILIKSQKLIDALFTLAPQVFEAQKNHPKTVAPIWLCDRRRLGHQLVATRGTYDNRYYIDDSLLPDMYTLKQEHISRIVYVSPEADKNVENDLTHFLADAADESIELFNLGIDNPDTWVEPIPMEAPFRLQVPTSEFSPRRSGGFGKHIPEVHQGTSSGYSSGYRGG